MGMLLRRYHGAPKIGNPQAALPEAPKKSDTAETWREYAAVRGWDATATKAKIIEQYEADVAAHTDAGSERATADGTEAVPDGVITASEPTPVGEGDQRDADQVGEGVTTSADLMQPAHEQSAPEGAPDAPGEGESPDDAESGGSGDESAE